MSVEKQIKAKSGWGMLAVVCVAFAAIIAVFILSVVGLAGAEDAGVPVNPLHGWGLGLSITAFCLIWIPVSGFFTLQPGQARVCILFGDYKGHGARRRLPLGQPVLQPLDGFQCFCRGCHRRGALQVEPVARQANQRRREGIQQPVDQGERARPHP